MGEVKDVTCLALRSEQCSKLAHPLDPSKKNRRQRKELRLRYVP